MRGEGLNNLIKIGVGALVRDEAGRVLLVKHCYHSYWYDKWILPGGMLEAGETLADGARREVLEETGLEVSIGRHLITFDRIVKTGNKVELHVVYIDFWAELISGTLRAGDDVGEAKWVEVEQLARIRPAIHVDAQTILQTAGLLV